MIIIFFLGQRYFVEGHRHPGPEGVDVAARSGPCPPRTRRVRDADAGARPRHRRHEARRRRRRPDGRRALVPRRAEPRATKGPTPTLARLFELGRRAVDESGIALGGDRGGRHRLRRAARRGARRPDRAAAPAGLARRPRLELAARAFELPVTLENDATGGRSRRASLGRGRGGAQHGLSHGLDRRRRRCRRSTAGSTAARTGTAASSATSRSTGTAAPVAAAAGAAASRPTSPAPRSPSARARRA